MKLQEQQNNFLNSREYKIPIKKSWGQNFLIDKNIINKIIKIINPNKNENIIEIGPGKGAITINLSEKVNEIHAVEIDPLLCNYLKQKKIKNIKLYNNDILKWQPPKKIIFDKVFGNVPYNISSQIIFKLLKLNICDNIIIMLQKELGERIVSSHGSKQYGRISVMVQTFYKVEIISQISKNVFYPKPKVSSCILKFKKKNININFENFEKLIKEAFKQRRKKLKNNLKNIKRIDSIFCMLINFL